MNQENRELMSEDVMEIKYKTGLPSYGHSAKLAEWLTCLYQLLSPQMEFNPKISFSIQLIKLLLFQLSLLHVTQTSSGAHPASYSMDTGGSFPGAKAAGA
jgi:hypothetical protein